MHDMHSDMYNGMCNDMGNDICSTCARTGTAMCATAWYTDLYNDIIIIIIM